MLHIDFDFGDPDDRGAVRALIDDYENRNADSKAADTSEPVTSITQNEHLVQDREIRFVDPFFNDLTSIMNKYGLSFTDNPNGGSASANKIGCKKHIVDNIDLLGLPTLDKTFNTLMLAYPSGGEKWNWDIVKDVWTFYKCCEASGVNVDTEKLASLLCECPHSHKEYTVGEFLHTITKIPGEATLRRYIKGFHGKNRLPMSILLCNSQREVTV